MAIPTQYEQTQAQPSAKQTASTLPTNSRKKTLLTPMPPISSGLASSDTGPSIITAMQSAFGSRFVSATKAALAAQAPACDSASATSSGDV